MSQFEALIYSWSTWGWKWIVKPVGLCKYPHTLLNCDDSFRKAGQAVGSSDDHPVLLLDLYAH